MADDVHPVVKAVLDHPGHAVVGAILGQVFIPIPIVGGLVGAAVGGWIGKQRS